ncbi:hypothetical protein LTR66_012494 [Elasticomyces elasticus]|nr:hypothetical protein LTR66_012494 [Elasticomyces elasticus]
MASTNLPTRTATNTTEEDAIPDEDTSEVTRLFNERLQAWKHAVAYLESYVESTEKMQHAHGKEYEKVLKTVSHPLKEGHHFEQSVGGVAGMFENIRSNTQGISNAHYETAKTIKGSILPVFERLHSEIKHKSKELTKGAGKGSKIVDKARAASQKHIELLGQHTATFDSTGGHIKAADDPYVLRRGVMHRLHKQVIEENNNRQDLLAVQNSFAQFEAHILQTIQSGVAQFSQILTSMSDRSKTLYGDMASTVQRISPDFEWNGFVKRKNDTLIDPSVPARSIENIAFPNMDHKATQPLISGSLERKSKVLKKYETGYYVVTPSRYLHEFKTDDDFAKEPQPETSLYLPDCTVGALDGLKFAIKGKDTSGGALSSKLSMSHEYVFKAHTPQDAQKWWEVIRAQAGMSSNEMTETSAPSTPTETTGSAAPSYFAGNGGVGGREAEMQSSAVYEEKSAGAHGGPPFPSAVYEEKSAGVHGGPPFPGKP